MINYYENNYLNWARRRKRKESLENWMYLHYICMALQTQSMCEIFEMPSRRTNWWMNHHVMDVDDWVARDVTLNINITPHYQTIRSKFLESWILCLQFAYLIDIMRGYVFSWHGLLLANVTKKEGPGVSLVSGKSVLGLAW